MQAARGAIVIPLGDLGSGGLTGYGTCEGQGWTGYSDIVGAP